MPATTTMPVLFQSGIHSGRPAAGDVGVGGLYACSTHGLIYQTDGSTWSTWATLGGSIADILDLPTAETGTTKVLKPDGAGGVVWGTDATGGGGGGGGSSPVLLQAPVRANGTNTISTMASGDRIIVAIMSFGGTVTGVACTNVTFTQVGTDLTVGGGKMSVWVGVATGTSGTSVTFTGSGTIINICAVVADALTPTLDVQASGILGGAFIACDAIMSGVTPGALVVAFGVTDNPSSPVWTDIGGPHLRVPQAVSIQATSLALGYAPDGDFAIAAISNNTSSGAIYAVSIV